MLCAAAGGWRNFSPPWRESIAEGVPLSIIMLTRALKPLPLLAIILLLDLLAFTLILPLFPSLIDHFSKRHKIKSDPIFSVFDSVAHGLQIFLNVPSIERNNGVFFGGILGSLFSFLQFLSSPIFGSLSDLHGRKSLLLVAVIGSLISYCLWSLSSESFSIFFVSRLIGGLSKASVSVAIAIVTDIMPTEERGKGMALIGGAFSLAFLIGPSIGAFFSIGARASGEFDPSPALLAIALTLAELALLVFFLPETLAKAKNDDCHQRSGHSLRHLLSPRALFSFDFLSPASASSPPVSVPLLQTYSRVYFLFLLLFSAMEFTLGFLTHLRFNYSSMEQGRLYLFSGFCMLIIQGFVVRRIPSTLKAQSHGALVGLVSIVPAYFVIAFAHCQNALFMGLLLYSVASATVVPFLTTLFSNQCDQSAKGACLGTFRSVGALARACGPLVGALLFWLLGPTLSYCFGAIGLIVPAIIFYRIRSSTQFERLIKED
ncbi:hypothetical protein niasHT_009877 [Heterodera trifolii]|uniref:Major facilitator superfamily (MFS) profile domain-containing protein n=1 Tax=Heterodera trifolii TaxID=157864 RepID=A0ABD2MDS2_9BILA